MKGTQTNETASHWTDFLSNSVTPNEDAHPEPPQDPSWLSSRKAVVVEMGELTDGYYRRTDPRSRSHSLKKSLRRRRFNRETDRRSL